jgi:hypothetical protein
LAKANLIAIPNLPPAKAGGNSKLEFFISLQLKLEAIQN